MHLGAKVCWGYTAHCFDWGPHCPHAVGACSLKYRWLQVSEVGGRVKDVKLKLTGRMDREMTPGYNMTVVALDGGRPARFAELTVHVVVVDANDNLPSFDHVEYLVEVREDVEPGMQCSSHHSKSHQPFRNKFSGPGY